MNFKRIFTMEMYKFITSKFYLYLIVGIGIFNLLTTIYVSSLISSNGADGYNTAFLVMLGITTYLLNVAGMIFIFIYPINSFSTDYKNNVMATIVSSGVSRKVLYFVKLLSILLNEIIMLHILYFLPLVVISQIRIPGKNEILISKMVESLQYILKEPLIILIIFLYLTLIVIVLVYSSILARGGIISIFIYIGFSILNAILLNLFTRSLTQCNGDVVTQWKTLITISVFIIAYVILSLRTINKQNL